jgi:hypothetical protein
MVKEEEAAAPVFPSPVFGRGRVRGFWAYLRVNFDGEVRGYSAAWYVGRRLAPRFGPLNPALPGVTEDGRRVKKGRGEVFFRVIAKEEEPTAPVFPSPVFGRGRVRGFWAYLRVNLGGGVRWYSAAWYVGRRLAPRFEPLNPALLPSSGEG